MALEVFLLGADTPVDDSGDRHPLGTCRSHSVEATQRMAGGLRPRGWKAFERGRCLSTGGRLLVSAVHGSADHAVYRGGADSFSDRLVCDQRHLPHLPMAARLAHD